MKRAPPEIRGRFFVCKGCQFFNAKGGGKCHFFHGKCQDVQKDRNGMAIEKTGLNSIQSL